MVGTQSSGCNSPIKDKNYLHCKYCQSTYDLLCANVSQKDYSSLSKDLKKDWRCPACSNKLPKKDNQNTPIRPQNNVLESHLNPIPSDNVTLRRNNLQANQQRKERINEKSFSSKVLEQTPDLPDMVRGEIVAALKSELPKLLKNILEAELKPLKEQVADLLASIDFVNQKYDEINILIKSQGEELSHLRSENNKLLNDVTELSTRLSTIEQHNRESNIEMHGLPEFKNENLPQVVNQIARAVSAQTTEDNVISCFRVAKINASSNRPRSVVVKLQSPRCRDTLLAAISKFNKNSQERLSTSTIGIGGDKKYIYVSEHLTPEKKSLHAATRIKAKELSYKYVWVRNGKIFIRKSDHSPAKVINSLSQLNSLQ